jgi:hypothetical protein
VMTPIVRYYGQDANGHVGDMSDGRSRKWGIFYSGTIDGHPVDDASVDPSIDTIIDFSTGRISRRVKHFSGYSIMTGAECTVSPDDPFCVERTGNE